MKRRRRILVPLWFVVVTLTALWLVDRLDIVTPSIDVNIHTNILGLIAAVCFLLGTSLYIGWRLANTPMIREFDGLSAGFVEGFQHQVKNHLQAVMSAVEDVEATTEHPGLTTITDRVVRLRRMGAALLRVTGLERTNLKIESVDLAELLESVIEDLPEGSSSRIDLQLRRVPRPPVVRGDPDLLAEAFYNVIENALKYSTPETTVEVRLREERGQSIVEVANTGCGIAAGDLPIVTEPFYRGRNVVRQDGMGMGLAVTRKIVAIHGGQLQINSQEDRWTEVRLRLPSVKGPSRVG